MTSDNGQLFGVETEDVKPPPLPTIAQFVRKTKEPKSKPILTVSIVWLPGQFNNITLQTPEFRVIITPNNPLFEPLLSSLTNEDSEPIGIRIRITDWRTPKYQLEEAKGDNRKWVKLGQNGLKWE